VPTTPSPLVLVVDDYADGREMVAEYLTFRGFQVLEARDGDEAIALARTMKPQIVLMDLQMPGIDGWEATRILKSDPETCNIAVVALTAHALKREVEAAFKVGCDVVIPKPCDIIALGDALGRMLEIGPKAFELAGLGPSHDIARPKNGTKAPIL
jgi:two-component system, cell cycle response regulator DivK